ncbi:MAG: carbon-nitrogen hydrolase family protein [Candidatus Hodarchaeales archaeon]
MNSSHLKITALQPRVKIDEFNYNLEQYRNLFYEFSLKNSDAICFPEYWNGMRKGSYTETMHDTSLNFLKEVATHYSTWVIGGSHLVKDKDSYFNRAHIFDPSGHLIGTYDKRHPFGYEQLQEITAGDNAFIWQIDDWKVTVQICSDLWNTNDYSSFTTKNIDLVFCPILTTLPDSSYTNYGRFMWHNLAVIRAKEAAAAVIVSDTAMQPIRDPYWCAGASCIADPSLRFTNEETVGHGILSTIPNGGQGVVSVTLDLNRIRDQKQYRKDIGLLST